MPRRQRQLLASGLRHAPGSFVDSSCLSSVRDIRGTCNKIERRAGQKHSIGCHSSDKSSYPRIAYIDNVRLEQMESKKGPGIETHKVSATALTANRVLSGPFDRNSLHPRSPLGGTIASRTEPTQSTMALEMKMEAIYDVLTVLFSFSRASCAAIAATQKHRDISPPTPSWDSTMPEPKSGSSVVILKTSPVQIGLTQCSTISTDCPQLYERA
jgi:hypothetical protein